MVPTGTGEGRTGGPVEGRREDGGLSAKGAGETRKKSRAELQGPKGTEGFNAVRRRARSVARSL